MKNKLVGLYFIIGLSSLAIVLVIIGASETWEYVLAGIASVLIMGLALRSELARKINAALFYLSAILNGLVVIVAFGYILASSDLDIGGAELSIGLAINAVSIAYNWWASRYLSRPSIKRWFNTNKFSKRDAVSGAPS